MRIMSFANVIGIKISYPTHTPGGSQKRTLTIYTRDGRDCEIDFYGFLDAPEFPVDVETPTDSCLVP